MSKRRRHPEKAAKTAQIEWLKHRTGYPSPEEREKILRLRGQLSLEMISLAIARAGSEDPRFRSLINRYGKDEVLRAEQALRASFDIPSRVASDAKSNRDYRLRYSRFGAGLPFLTAQQRDELYDKYAEKFMAETENEGVFAEPNEAEKVLLIDWRSWEDITPPAIPPRPADFSAPSPATYPASIAELLEYGNNLDRPHQFENEQEVLQWRKSIPALTRMALDPGLLQGWPADPASWAPWHAIHVLGDLQAWESVPALAELADLEEDWLSDHLTHIWADMGQEAEPMLWMILEDRSASAKRRGLAAEALFLMSENNEAVYDKVVKGFEKLLRNEKSFDPSLNGYLITFLQSMDALDAIHSVIAEAFSQGRVDPEIITLEDLEEDDLDDEEELD